MVKRSRRPIWSPEARQDLVEIWIFLEKEASSEVADRQLRKIGEACERLREWPHSGRRRDELLPGLRSFAVRPNVVFYRVHDGRVEVVRVIDGRRDLDAIFSEEDD